MHAFVRRLIRLRSDHCTFRRETFLRGSEPEDSPLPDVWWFRADGRRMTPKDWEHGEAALGMFLNGQAITSRGPQGQTIDDDTFILLFNAHFEDRQFRLPRVNMGRRWELELSTAEPAAEAGANAAETARPEAARERITAIIFIPFSSSERCGDQMGHYLMLYGIACRVKPAFWQAGSETAPVALITSV